MHNLRRFYYSNKNKIWKVVLIVAFLLGTIYFLDNTAIERKNNEDIYTQPDKLIYENDETQTYIKDKSATTGSIVTETEVKKINETISRFLQYCKTDNTQEAYNMLSADCIANEYNSLYAPNYSQFN
jgi:cytochrome c-type biogenesis protein CcmE